VSTTTSVCTVASAPGPNTATVHPEAAGLCTITAQSAGIFGVGAALDVSATFRLGATQAITFPAGDPTAGTDHHAVNAGDFNVTAASNSSLSPDAVFPASNDPTLNVTFTSATPSICTVAGVPGPNGATIHPVAPGTCTVTAHSAAVVGIADAPNVNADILIDATQAITFPAANATAGTNDQVVGANFVVTAAANSSASPPAAFPGSNNPGLSVTFTSSTPSVCLVLGSNGNATALVEPDSAGTCTLTAHSAAIPGVTAAADVTTDITILAAQVITFPAADAVAGTDDHAVGGGDFDIRAAANSSGSPAAVFPASNDPNLNVTFTSLTPSVCTIAAVPGPNTATIHPEAVGTCTIIAQSAAVAGVAAAPNVGTDINIV